MLSFEPAFSVPSFTFIKRLFSSSLLSTIRVVSSAYLRLLIILPAILILACASSSPASHMMYSAYTLEKEIATHSSILAWKIPWTEESGRLQSMRAERSYSTFKVRRGSSEEIPLVQGKRNPSKTVGVGRGHQRADTLKP